MDFFLCYFTCPSDKENIEKNIYSLFPLLIEFVTKSCDEELMVH